MWRSFAAHPGLAVRRRRPWWPSPQPMAPTSATSCRDHRMGRAGRDPGGLHPTRREHALPGYCRAVASAGCGPGDRRWLCRTCSGMRPRAGSRADARDKRYSYSSIFGPRPVLVLAPALLGHSLGLAARLAAAVYRAGWRCLPSVSSKTRCDSPLAYGALPRPALRSAVRPPRSRSVSGWHC